MRVRHRLHAAAQRNRAARSVDTRWRISRAASSVEISLAAAACTVFDLFLFDEGSIMFDVICVVVVSGPYVYTSIRRIYGRRLPLPFVIVLDFD